ncbi:MFS transporter [Streptomyces sp. TRM 70361]|uniref:MFS transporter n=1 Tax=Streptomyces sp. TRM 70361 TaxID=3116553 RepID=UPI002E7B441C|nr:MFS transporter [Streptomyces sp. TRM 70361]MEE1938038.1 MFS transporter [Streptomyces sp. TRM 70361]
MTAQSAPRADDRTSDTPGGLLPLLTAGMGLAMFVLFALGALGPRLLGELEISRSQLGTLTALAFGTASVLSLYTGHLTDILGGRRTLTALLVTVAAAFTVLSLGGEYGWLLLALLLAGIAQAFANPATNRLIAVHLPPPRRAAAVGVKQSGVQIGAFAAGLLLPSLAAALSWRTALALVVPVALAAAALALRLPPDHPPAERRAGGLLPAAPNAPARWLIGYSFGVGTGLAALNTYLPLYAHEELGMGERASGGLIAALGVAGIAARVLWTRHSGRVADISVPLLVLAGVSVCLVLLLPAATALTPLVWLGAVGLGGTAVAANAVSMVAVVRSPAFGATGHASALVSMGFFGGFVAGPLAFGLLADGPGGYQTGWGLVGAAFLASVLCGARLRQVMRR